MRALRGLHDEPFDLRAADEEMSPGDPRLNAVYTWLYFAFRWPSQLPSPDEVIVRWNPRFRNTSGACHPNRKVIEINRIYRDSRLRRELEYLLIHEAAHFIWRGHPPVFKAFLRSLGVPESYVLHSSAPSRVYLLVHDERTQLPLFA
jgi:hypothetical protein